MKMKYYMRIGYNFWKNTFGAEMKPKTSSMKDNIIHHNKGVDGNVIDEIIEVMNSNNDGVITIAEFFDYMAIYQDYFKESKDGQLCIVNA